jgi:hypothetical protein
MVAFTILRVLSLSLSLSLSLTCVYTLRFVCFWHKVCLFVVSRKGRGDHLKYRSLTRTVVVKHCLNRCYRRSRVEGGSDASFIRFMPNVCFLRLILFFSIVANTLLLLEASVRLSRESRGSRCGWRISHNSLHTMRIAGAIEFGVEAIASVLSSFLVDRQNKK